MVQHKITTESEKMILDLIPEVWAYSPAKIINSQIEKKIIDRIVKPTLKALRNKKNLIEVFIRRFND